MLYLFLSDLLFFFVFSGIGCLGSSFTFLKLRRDNFFLNFFLGFSLSAIYFSLINFFLPLTVWTLLPVILAGLFGFVLFVSRGNVFGALSGKRWFVLVCVLLFFFVCYQCSKAEGVSLVDTLLYHATVVSWMNAYKVVPGLVNVFGPLGSNSLYLQLAAGLDVGLWDKQMSSVLFSLFYAAFMLYALTDIRNAAVKKQRNGLSFVLFQSVMVIWFFSNNILDDPSLYYDKPALVFIAVTLAELLACHRADAFRDSAETSSCEAIFLFIATAFGIKLLGALSVAFIFVYILMRQIREKKLSMTGLLGLGVLPLLILVLYVARNLIQSGYPFIPSTVFRMDFPWTTPESIARKTYQQIYWGTRWNGEGASWGSPASSFSAWFIPWCQRLLRPGNWQFIGIMVVSLPLVVRSAVKRHRGAFFFYFLALANLVYWFATAPNLRFGNGFFYDLLAVAVFLNADIFATPIAKAGDLLRRLQPAVQTWGTRLRTCCSKQSTRLIALALLVIIACVLSIPAVQDLLISLGGSLKGKELSAPHWRREIYKCVCSCAIIAAALVLLPAVLGRGRKDRPFALACYALAVFCCCMLATKNRNLIVTIPVRPEPTERRLVNEEQGLYINVSTHIDLCGDAPLPCTPEGSFRTDLRLFDKDDMGKGFYIAE